ALSRSLRSQIRPHLSLITLLLCCVLPRKIVMHGHSWGKQSHLRFRCDIKGTKANLER
ncbi:hypothetical protein LINPERHAP1_LOCUS27758, partial [Linum perenne]